MATSLSKTRSSGPVLRSLSPPGRLYYSNAPNSSFSSSSSVFASYTSSSFSSPSTTFFHHDLHRHHYDNNHHHHHHHHQQRSASPTRVNLYTSGSLSPSVRFSIDHRSISPNRNQVIASHHSPMSIPKKRCTCSPTTHPGSFRCHLHKKASNSRGSHHAAPYPNNGLNMRRSAMKNSLVRIGGVEGEWVKRALTALIRPSSHQLRRRAAFEPTPSRLSIMSRVEDL
ncbi:one cut domain family member 2 [Juglans microcarpa x Juglans regia]|uniref:one cut domain family member 2 n=1 Tax=Juglans microcarpa x Juglans regia TaxID=2249226 RepID=UPI001B7E9F32|nr:one cut domain family member 2 [Juglans microcarpa x Juglans regia]